MKKNIAYRNGGRLQVDRPAPEPFSVPSEIARLYGLVASVLQGQQQIRVALRAQADAARLDSLMAAEEAKTAGAEATKARASVAIERKAAKQRNGIAEERETTLLRLAAAQEARVAALKDEMTVAFGKVDAWGADVDAEVHRLRQQAAAPPPAAPEPQKPRPKDDPLGPLPALVLE